VINLGDSLDVKNFNHCFFGVSNLAQVSRTYRRVSVYKHQADRVQDTTGEWGGECENRVVLAKTKKGKGVSFMENVAKWHHGVPNDDEFNRAIAELEAAEAAAIA